MKSIWNRLNKQLNLHLFIDCLLTTPLPQMFTGFGIEFGKVITKCTSKMGGNKVSLVSWPTFTYIKSRWTFNKLKLQHAVHIVTGIKTIMLCKLCNDNTCTTIYNYSTKLINISFSTLHVGSKNVTGIIGSMYM